MLIHKSEWEKLYPGASVGILIISAAPNQPCHDKLNIAKQELEATLREKYQTLTRKELREVYPLDTYTAYYKKFGNNYHVLHQLESVIKGKSIPTVSSLVQAMFMAELKNLLLTAGHDYNKVKLPLECKLSAGNEQYHGISGRDIYTTSGDMIIQDGAGIISSILKGPDSRTRIGLDTTCALFTVYAPPGITESSINQHLEDIENYIRIVSDAAVTEAKQVYSFQA